MKNIASAAGLALGLSLAGQAALAQDGAVAELADRWASAYNQHDREALGALYTEDAQLYLHGLPSYVGREDITDFWAEDMQVGNPLTVLNVTNSVAGIDMTLVHGNYQVINRDTGLVEGEGRFAHIWLLGEDGDWHLDRDLWNQPYE